MIKDIKTVNTSLKSSKLSLELMFKMLGQILSLNKDLANVKNSNIITGKLKKGIPGFNELGLPVEISISTVMNRMMEIICMNEAQWQLG